MGGFVTRDGHHPIVILARPQLSQYLEKIGEIKEEDIEDKSKDDTLLKLLTAMQIIWFVVQCIIRHKRGLPILGIETVTVGLAFIHICIWVVWRKKPRNVSQAVLIDPVSPSEAIVVGLEAKIRSSRPLLPSRRRPSHSVE
jgi:hypothetical protein